MPAASAVTLNTASRQVSDGNSQGTILGVSATDKISFYGATPVTQPSGSSQAAVTRGQAAGMVATFSTTQSPASIATITSAEQALTVQSGTGGAFLLATGDVIVINKPTAQAGIGIGNLRFSAANSLGITFINPTAAALTPTGSELYSGVILRGIGSLSATLSPAAVLANTTVEQQFTVTGIRAGDLIQVSKPTSQAGIDITGVRAVATNVVGITFSNVTAATVTPTAAQSYTFVSLGGLDATSNNLMAQINIVSTLAAGVATVTTSEIAGLTITGLAATDSITGVSKDTQQAGLGIAGYRVSTANTLAIAWVNPTAATLTPTASHVYQVGILRPNPAAPLLNYTQTLTPTSVAANTTAEQTFTVTGLVALSPVWVNKPSAQPGLGIVGCRVSAASTLAITYMNTSGAAIVPAAEAYVIGNFQLPFNSADGVTMLQGVAPSTQGASVLGNSMRAAMVSLGLVAGA